MRRWLVALIIVMGGAAGAAAGGPERVPAIAHPATAKECGECHMAFQPALLPAGSWLRIMDGLADHFGEDASLPADLTASIRAYLAANAGRSGDPKITRITEQSWFAKEHRFRASVWQRPEIKTKSNCLACHPRAEQGNYDDD
ncbi:Cytochrome C [uncultured Defluviicoccus sp.]|uniref:Cytochrome C n=1 Tax=metagenome TaxID=256318 RepID=A0A380TF72_9ZZZZ|nr:Cytochrome C [uncultured Defluviicoccus sp.]